MDADDTFARWQPIYAERGINLFPVVVSRESKKPLVKNYLKTSRASSAKFVERFGSERSFGFACGKPSDITIIDVDTVDASAVDEARRIFGDSPILIKTGGKGGFQIPFRHNGEGRHVRAISGLPIDVLGGGYAVAPPSLGTQGFYEIVRGALEDLDRLPKARIPEWLRTLEAVATLAPSSGLTPEGQRHQALKERLNRDIWHVDSLDQLLDCAMTFGKHECDPAMDDAEITALASWFWNTKERGLLRRSGHRDWLTDAAELMTEDRDAAAILVYLRHHHPEGHRFYIANALAKTLKMDRERFAEKRRYLADCGLIRMVAASSRTKERSALWTWP